MLGMLGFAALTPTYGITGGIDGNLGRGQGRGGRRWVGWKMVSSKAIMGGGDVGDVGVRFAHPNLRDLRELREAWERRPGDGSKSKHRANHGPGTRVTKISSGLRVRIGRARATPGRGPRFCR